MSRLVVPNWLRHRAISVDVSTRYAEVPVGSDVPFVVTMRNSMPFPVTIPTVSPVLWTWSVDGLWEASHVPPDDPREFRFGRGERKRFVRRWDQRFRVSESVWEPAARGSTSTIPQGAG